MTAMADTLERATYPDRLREAATDFLCNAFASPALVDAPKIDTLTSVAMCILNETMWIQPSDAQVVTAYRRECGMDFDDDGEDDDELPMDEPTEPASE
jgi:hypothetical protein